MAGFITYPRTDGARRAERDIYRLEEMIARTLANAIVTASDVQNILLLLARIGWHHLTLEQKRRLRALICKSLQKLSDLNNYLNQLEAERAKRFVYELCLQNKRREADPYGLLERFTIDASAYQPKYADIAPYNMVEKGSVGAGHMHVILRVSVIPTIANRVIYPNWTNFKEKFPYIELIIETSQSHVDLLRSAVDLTICYNRFDDFFWEGCEQQKLLDINIQPVFSSKVDQDYTLSESPENIICAPLIHTVNTPDAWREFLINAGLGDSLAEEKFQVNDYQAAIEAVLNDGVALTLYPLEKSYVNFHQLVAPHKLSIQDGAIFAVAKQGRLREERIHRFITWLYQQLHNLS